MRNQEIAELFIRMADVLEFKGENIFRVNAYRKAARTLEQLTEDIEIIHREERLRQIPGIGEGIAKDIQDYLATNRYPRYEEESWGIPEGIYEMLRVPGMGPKTVGLIYKTLHISNLTELEKALQEHKIKDLPGMGAKKEENILNGIRIIREGNTRMPLGIAVDLVSELMTYLAANTDIQQMEAAGSYRRMKETLGDIDILVTGKNPDKIIRHFVAYPEVKEVLGAGETKSSVRIGEHFQVDLRVVEDDSFGAALQYFTGSKEHNVKLREIARQKGLKINEYGVFRGDDKIGGKTEADVYASLNLPWIPPEMREDFGEIELAMAHQLPVLIERKDIQGDFHSHTDWSDGKNTMEEMIEAARGKGYRFLGITDHSTSVKIAGGLEPDELLEQINEIKKVQKKYKEITLLAGSEVDIKTDGSLDYPDEILKELDIVIASLHFGSKKDEKENTRRMLAAIHNPYVNIIAHPTMRLLGERDEYPLDMDAVMKAALETGTALEINSSPLRLDLNDRNTRKARDMGIIIAINTDSHKIASFDSIHLGLGVARRAWLTRENVLNCWSLDDIREFRSRKIKRM